MINKFLINILTGIFPFSHTRKKIRASLKKKLYKKIICIMPNGHTKTVRNIDGLNIDTQCENYKIIIHMPCSFSNCNFIMRYNAVIEIFETKNSIHNLHISTGENSTVKIDKNFLCHGCSIECHDEAGLNVNIGSDCMFSYGINIRTSDGHTIYDVDSKTVLNRPKQGINIGSHVWLGMYTKILKDVNLPNNTIVGANTLVTKSFNKSNTIICGVPAKVVQENVNWSHPNTDFFKNTVQS